MLSGKLLLLCEVLGALRRACDVTSISFSGMPAVVLYSGVCRILTVSSAKESCDVLCDEQQLMGLVFACQQGLYVGLLVSGMLTVTVGNAPAVGPTREAPVLVTRRLISRTNLYL